MSQNTAKTFFSKEEQKQIIDAIQKAESKTSSEIRLHIDTHTSLDALDRAAYLFKKMDMNKTEARNGVLLYMSIQNKYFAIIGDAGINRFVKDIFWEDCKEEALIYFQKSKFCYGIIHCIEKVGDALETYFPYQEDDVNELPDELSFD